MKKKMDREIKLGEETIVGGTTVICVESDGNCYSKKDRIACIHRYDGCRQVRCIPDTRTDKRYICLIEKESIRPKRKSPKTSPKSKM